MANAFYFLLDLVVMIVGFFYCDHEVCIVFKEKKINSFPLNFVSPSHLILVVLVFLNPEELSVEKFILSGSMSIF